MKKLFKLLDSVYRLNAHDSIESAVRETKNQLIHCHVCGIELNEISACDYVAICDWFGLDY